ncbi:MAG: DUF72 domain-containing protein [Planctomycetes bacterium]|nr:DUF72 domain-containing protein [Planctomycetota bacterium]
MAPRPKRSDGSAGPQPRQLGLFGPEPAADDRLVAKVAPAAVPDDVQRLAARLPPELRLGTSSWSFAGWRGLVYAPDAPKAHLSRHGLGAYAQHPLLRTVGVDRTFYAPIAADEFAAYAAQVPASFRFLVKALGELLSPQRPGGAELNPRYLDGAAFLRECVEPARLGLGPRLGTLLLQFPPQGPEVVRDPRRFADRLHGFLGRVPLEVPCAVELRDAELFTPHYRDALRALGVQHAYTVHPRMPSLSRQRELVPLDGPLVVRWMLHQGLAYEAAVERYEPFDRLVDPDPATRSGIAALVHHALQQSRAVTVVVNNKAEGSSPCSVLALAQAIVALLPE